MRPEKDNKVLYAFPKKYRIHSKILIRELIENNASLFCYPFKYYFRFDPVSAKDDNNSMAISVPKRLFRKAVDRNRIKRIVKEAYRLNHHSILESKTLCENRKVAIFLIYVSTKIESFHLIENQLKELLNRIVVSENERHEDH